MLKLWGKLQHATRQILSSIEHKSVEVRMGLLAFSFNSYGFCLISLYSFFNMTLNFPQPLAFLVA